MMKLVNKLSFICNLDLFMGDGLLCVGGCLRYVSIEVEVRNFIILLKKVYVVDLFVRYYYVRVGYFGREYVLSLICEKYWIIKGRMVVCRVLSSCFDCKWRL